MNNNDVVNVEYQEGYNAALQDAKNAFLAYIDYAEICHPNNICNFLRYAIKDLEVKQND